MNALYSVVFVLFVRDVACGGLVDGIFSQEAVEKQGYKESTAHKRTDIQELTGKGAFSMELAPFTDKLGGSQTYVRVFWRDTEMIYYPLELVRINWPRGTTPSTAVTRDSIKPEGIDSKNQLTIKYLKKSGCIVKHYNWQSGKYVSGKSSTLKEDKC